MKYSLTQHPQTGVKKGEDHIIFMELLNAKQGRSLFYGMEEVDVDHTHTESVQIK